MDSTDTKKMVLTLFDAHLMAGEKDCYDEEVDVGWCNGNMDDEDGEFHSMPLVVNYINKNVLVTHINKNEWYADFSTFVRANFETFKEFSLENCKRAFHMTSVDDEDGDVDRYPSVYSGVYIIKDLYVGNMTASQYNWFAKRFGLIEVKE